MDGTYGHLSLEERCTIAQLHEAGQSCRAIAAALDRAASTVSRELKRNRGSTVGYRAGYAAEQAWARRWRGSRQSPGPRQVALIALAHKLLVAVWALLRHGVYFEETAFAQRG